MSNTAAYVLKEVNIMDTGDHISAIHTTLPMEQLVEIVESELRGLIRYDSFEYANPQNSTHVFFGTPRPHRCQYRIYVSGVALGQITLSRSVPFEDVEVNMIEGALGALIIHLNNALEYQSDLSEEDLTNLRVDRALLSVGK